MPWKHRGSAKFEHQIKIMGDSWFALLNQNVFEQLKEKAKNENAFKAIQTCLKVWQTWVTEREVNLKIEKYEHEQHKEEG